MQPISHINQDKLLIKLSVLSLIIHVGVFWTYNKISWFKTKPFNTEEWSVDVDIVISDMSTSNAKDNIIPNAQTADEIAISERLLPQLTKNFTIQKTQDQEQTSDDYDTIITKQENISETSLTKSIPQKDEKDEAPNLATIENSSIEDKDNKLTIQEALKRLALEKLRQEAIIKKQSQSTTKGTIARLKDFNNENTSANAIEILALKEYKNKLKAHIGKFWSLPEAYNLKDTNLLVVISIKVDPKGNLNYIDIKKSSSDKVFDEFAINAVKNATPLPSPPAYKVNEEMLLYFTPKSF